MSTSERTGELRARAVPYLMRAIAGGDGPKPQGQAGLSKMARERFDELLATARTFHTEHLEEDADLHMAHLLQIFVAAGMPALESIPAINELVLDPAG